jgi:hypothetical protein
MNRKEKLINSLTIAVNALKNDIVFYDWTHQDSCNAGVVSQAVLGVNQEELKKLRSPMFNVLDGVNKRRKENSQNQLEATWKNAVKNTCSITGKNLPKIIGSRKSRSYQRGYRSPRIFGEPSNSGAEWD